jgi:hypothetical protein
MVGGEKFILLEAMSVNDMSGLGYLVPHGMSLPRS